MFSFHWRPVYQDARRYRVNKPSCLSLRSSDFVLLGEMGLAFELGNPDFDR
jgi:hypothetical protein